MLLTPLTIIFNRSINLSQVPQQWRGALISPIYKKGDRQKAANNRPVSLTSIVYEVLEKLVVKHLELKTSAETT